MDSCPIPRLPEIGEGTLAVLRAAGIRTARDIIDNQYGIQQLPGIGPGRSAILIEWAYAHLTQTDAWILEKRQQEAKRSSDRLGMGCLVLIGLVILGLIVL